MDGEETHMMPIDSSLRSDHSCSAAFKVPLFLFVMLIFLDIKYRKA
jgi:hypothetical protein